MAITVNATPLVEIYDDADATNHAGAPGTHTDAELAAFGAATFTDRGDAPKAYGAGLTIQMGKSPGSAFTSWTVTDDVITLLAGKQITVLSAAGPNCWLKWGTKVGSGNIASGKRGPKIRGGNALTLNCNIEAYGLIMESETGSVSLGNLGGLTKVEIMNALVKAATVINVGVGGTPVPVIYNVDFMSDTTVASVINTINTKRAERGTVTATNPVGFILWNSGVTPELRDFQFFGTPSGGDVRITSSPTLPLKVVRHRWSGNGPRFQNTANFTATSPDVSTAAQEYGVYTRQFQTEGGIIVPGMQLRMVDSLGVEVFPWTAADASGEIFFGDAVNTNYGNAVRVLDYYRITSGLFYAWRDRGPFTEQWRDPNGYFVADQQTKRWPQGSDAYGPVLRDWDEVIIVRTPQSFTTESLPLAAKKAERMLTPV